MKHFMKISILLCTLAFLGGCASSGKLDSDITESVSTFKSHNDIKEAFHSLEKSIDDGDNINRFEVHAAGFDPSKTAVIILDWTDIGDKFTAGGNEVLAATIKEAGGEVVPPPVVTCLKTGKNCTAYRVKVESTRSIERPKDSMATVRSVLDLKEVRHITSWKFSCIIVFNGNTAVYAQTEEDIAPNTAITVDKNSLIKKIGHAVTP